MSPRLPASAYFSRLRDRCGPLPVTECRLNLGKGLPSLESGTRPRDAHLRRRRTGDFQRGPPLRSFERHVRFDALPSYLPDPAQRALVRVSGRLEIPAQGRIPTHALAHRRPMWSVPPICRVRRRGGPEGTLVETGRSVTIEPPRSRAATVSSTAGADSRSHTWSSSPSPVGSRYPFGNDGPTAAGGSFLSRRSNGPHSVTQYHTERDAGQLAADPSRSRRSDDSFMTRA